MHNIKSTLVGINNGPEDLGTQVTFCTQDIHIGLDLSICPIKQQNYRQNLLSPDVELDAPSSYLARFEGHISQSD